VDSFRQYCSEVISGVSENLCTHYEREIQQLTSDLVNCRSQLSRCAELLSQQLDKEKTYRDIIQKLAESSLRVAAQSTPPNIDDSMKQQLHEMLEAMHMQNSSLFEDGFGQLHEHKRLAESHLMTSAELQNQGEAIQKELSSIMELLKEPPVRLAKFQLSQPRGEGSSVPHSAIQGGHPDTAAPCASRVPPLPERKEAARPNVAPVTSVRNNVVPTTLAHGQCPAGGYQAGYRSEMPKWSPTEAADRHHFPSAPVTGLGNPTVKQTTGKLPEKPQVNQVRFQFGQKSS